MRFIKLGLALYFFGVGLSLLATADAILPWIDRLHGTIPISGAGSLSVQNEVHLSLGVLFLISSFVALNQGRSMKAVLRILPVIASFISFAAASATCVIHLYYHGVSVFFSWAKILCLPAAIGLLGVFVFSRRERTFPQPREEEV